MSVAALNAAAIEVSGNTAANLILRSVGGPLACTQFARSIGCDTRSRLDRAVPQRQCGNSRRPPRYDNAARDGGIDGVARRRDGALIVQSLLAAHDANRRRRLFACRFTTPPFDVAVTSF
jgi:hypothetical protein